MGQECPTSCLLFGWKILPGDGVVNQVQVAIARQLQTVREPVYRITGVNISTVVGDRGAGAGRCALADRAIDRRLSGLRPRVWLDQAG